MKTIKILILLTIFFCRGNHLFAQPGESDKKHNIHEIKLHEKEDGSKVGVIAWTSASPDSIQKFVIRNLDIMEPVQVILQSLSLNDEVTLQFIKEKWDQPESSISAKGKTMGKKVFRTYKTAAMSIKAKKSGIPYLILVQIGKELPLTRKPIFKLINDKNEYNNYLKNNGIKSKDKSSFDSSETPINDNNSGKTSNSSNSFLLYIIIGLLLLVVAFLGYFVFNKKKNGKIMLLILLLGFGINVSWSQSDSPTPFSTEEINNLLNLEDVLTPQDGDIPVIEYGSPEWYNENPIPIIESEGGMTEDDFKKMVIQMREEFMEFKGEFVDGMPGEDIEGGGRIIPPGVSDEDFNRLQIRIRNLERQVEFLSERDRNYAPDEGNQEQIPVFCENIEACLECLMKPHEDIAILQDKFRDLNNILTYNDWVMETGIATGNNLANMAPGFGLGWQRQLLQIQQSRKDLWLSYHNKYGELMERLNNLERGRESCLEMFKADELVFDWRESVKDNIRMETPELVTPLF